MTETLSDCLRCNEGTNKEHIRDVKEKVQNAQRRLKSEVCLGFSSDKDYCDECRDCREINKVFKEEFGDKLVAEQNKEERQ